MAQLIVRQIEESVVRKLREQAAREGVSVEEEHRRVLRKALLGRRNGPRSFKDALLAMPNVGTDQDFARGPQMSRKVKL